MKKYIGAIVGTLLFVGLIALAANMSSSDSEIDFFSDYEPQVYSQYPSMNITYQTLRNWTGNYWNYSQYYDYYVYVRNVTVTSLYQGGSYYYASVNITFDAFGNNTYYEYYKAMEYYRTAEISINGPKGYVSVYNVGNLGSLSVYDIAEFLRLYSIYVIQPKLDRAFYANTTSNSSSNSSYNYSNSSYNYNYSNSSYNYNSSINSSNYTNSSSYNTSNGTTWAKPGPFYGPINLTVSLPAQNITWSNMSIYVYSATFYGNSSSSRDYNGRIYARFNVNAYVGGGWYGYYNYFYDQEIIYDAYSAYSCNEYYDHSLVQSSDSTLSSILFSYYWSYANPAILSAIGNSSSNTTNSTNTTQYLPNAYFRGENLTTWYNASWWTFSNYTTVGYQMYIWNANFTGNVGKWDVNGTIRVAFDAYGNNSYSPYYNMSQIWVGGIATIDLFGSWVSRISFDRQLNISSSDLMVFLRAWVNFQVVPYLLKNSSNTTTGIQFPAYNITGYDLNNWIQPYNSFYNYTWVGASVNISNFITSLEKSGNTVWGNVSFSMNANGDGRTYPCDTSMSVYVDGNSPDRSGYYVYTNDYCRYNWSEVDNFLRGYYRGIMVPKITSYYNLTTSNSTTNTTQYLPYARVTGENLTSWYHSDWWTFLNYTSVNYTVSVWNANFTGAVGKRDVNGTIKVTFDAYGNNSYSPYYNMSQIWEYNVGATIDLYGSSVYSIYFDRQLAIDTRDLNKFLTAWVYNVVVPYLLKNSSNTTTGIQFPERNITGYDLNNWIGQYNAYPNYTWAGYYVYVYNFASSLQKSGNSVYGTVNFSLIAFGNDSYYPCWGWNCSQTTVYANGTMNVYVDGDRPTSYEPYIYDNYYSRVNWSDVTNFLRGYYKGVMVPKITSYYNLTSNTTTNTTQYLPDARVTGENLTSWYNASWWTFLNYTSVGYSLTIWNANFTGVVGKRDVNGTIKVTFNAYGNNSYSPYYNMSQLWEHNVGATIDMYGPREYGISFNRQLAIDSIDLYKFLIAWVDNVVVPYLLKNSSNTTTGIQFPERNITGYDLNNWIQPYNSFYNYTQLGVSVKVSNFITSLQKSGNTVWGNVNFSMNAREGGRTYPCDTAMSVYVDGDRPDKYVYYLYTNDTCSYNWLEVDNFLRGYYRGVMVPNITSYYNLTSNTTTNTTQYLPNAYLRGENLTSWYNASWWTFLNYTSVGYSLTIWNANFTGVVGKRDVNGTIRVSFDAYGNNSYSPYYNMSQLWEYNVGATIDVYGSWVYGINFDRQLAIYPSDLRNFLSAWANYVAIPYLLRNSSNSTGIKFPERNVTGFDLNNWIGRYNAYPNYTWAGYYVSLYNIVPNLQQYGNNVSGTVNFSFVAFGNDTAYPCWGWNCSQTTVYSNATMYIYLNGDRVNDSLPYFYVDYYLRVNSSDISNFLRGYYFGVMVPKIVDYYNLTTSNSTTPNRTIYLPNYYNNTQLSIDCSRQPWYCSGAHGQSSLYFTNAMGYNLSITVNERGNGNFNGMLNLDYNANLINFTSSYKGKETIVANLQGNASIYLWGWVNGTGNNSYYVTLSNYGWANVDYDRSNFVQNAAQQLYSDRFQWYLQNFLNTILSNGTRTRYY